LKTTIDNASQITGDLSNIADNIQSGKGSVGRLLMNPSIAHNIDSTLVNLKEGSSNFKNLINDAKSGFAQNLDSTLVNLDNILISLKTTVDNVSNVTRDFSNIADNIQSENGTIGRLLMDQSMAQNLDSTLVNLKEGLVGFKILMKEAKDSWLLWGF
ncbi:MAG: hypothetical protein JXB42_08235, partial [Deltaproteobacteria bacterium]|nr:hypothetical protein [Deltaproteobacteria bacterium]